MALQPFKTSGTIYQTMHQNIPEDLSLQHHHCENLKIQHFCTHCWSFNLLWHVDEHILKSEVLLVKRKCY